MSHPTGVHVIAEAGTNHGGQLETGKRLVDIAAEAGADSVKFQVIYPEGLYLPELVTDEGYVENEVFRQRADAMLADDDYRALAAHARERGLPLSASVFDRRGLDLLDELDAPYVKIASCDLNNVGLLREAASRGRTLVVSTGMSSLAEIEAAVAAVAAEGSADLVLLHCVSVYPAPTERMNLHFLVRLRETFGTPVGLSDHTEEGIAAAMAVALGATWIEKHVTYDRSASGFDHAYAMEPDAFADFVGAIRRGEAALAAPEEKVGAEEAAVRQRARRGLYAARDLSVGDVLAAADVLVVRPEGPLEPGDLPRVLGRRAGRQIRRFEPLSEEALA